MKKMIALLLTALTIFIFFTLPSSTLAADCTVTTQLPKSQADQSGSWYLLGGVSSQCFDCGDCNICDFLSMYIWAANWFVSIAGGVALLMLIYGGFTWLTSAGSQNLITKGKTIMVNTAIALIIILGGWMIVNTIINLVVGTSLGGTAKVGGFTEFWSTPTACQTSSK